jgi:hypothetical protein
MIGQRLGGGEEDDPVRDQDQGTDELMAAILRGHVRPEGAPGRDDDRVRDGGGDDAQGEDDEDDGDGGTLESESTLRNRPLDFLEMDLFDPVCTITTIFC